MSIHERDEIELYATDKNGRILTGFYHRNGNLVTDIHGAPITAVTKGDTVYTGDYPRHMHVVLHIHNYVKKPVSAYDLLKVTLGRVKEHHSHANDSASIIIASDGGVLYDKIIHLMDCARAVDYPDISIARIRVN